VASANFANPERHVQSWYPVMRSRALRRGRVKAQELFGRRLAFFRGASGTAAAVEARCPHLGADLSQGKVRGEQLECFFHGWCFDAEGRCAAAPKEDALPGRRARAYPVQERDGLIWVFNGPRPSFELPCAEDGGGFRLLAGNSVRAHPHLTAGNGLDSTHLETMHGATLLGPPVLEEGPAHLTSARIRARIDHPFWGRVTGLGRRPLDSHYRCLGGNLAVWSVHAPVPFEMLFAGRGLPGGGTYTYLLARYHGAPGLDWARCVALMLLLLPDDEKILNHIDFQPLFTPADEVFKRLTAQVDAMPVW
jgi:nitrite reductase/ring-hydroxylating ferredoxin subunit